MVIRGKGQMDRSTYIRQNVETFHNNTTTSRYQESGLSEEKAKLNHAGFNKLMDQRGISEEAVYAMMAQARIDSICHKISDEEMKKKVQEYLEGEREE